jgi:glucose-1-phosphate cytidylyltransferase
MQTVILCGGEGTRYQHFSTNDPKVLASIGNWPMLWHIMKYYQSFGHRDFILCLGHYKDKVEKAISSVQEDWTVNFVDTGLSTPTGGRVKLLQDIVEGDQFFVTYGDGLSDVNLPGLLDFHKNHGKAATLTSYRPYNQYGVLEIDDHDHVLSFKEKPRMTHYVNGGFFVFNRSVFDSLLLEDDIETNLFTKLTARRELMAYKHDGFWKSMDTYKENQQLNELWEEGKAPWLNW